jgi:hypothetical protein
MKRSIFKGGQQSGVFAVEDFLLEASFAKVL